MGMPTPNISRRRDIGSLQRIQPMFFPLDLFGRHKELHGAARGPHYSRSDFPSSISTTIDLYL
jgi:hypothetical protein